MRSVIYGAIITVFLASAGTVQAANELDGKSLLCTSANSIHPVYGYVFDQGKVTKWWVHGLSKSRAYNGRTYEYLGSKRVYWVGVIGRGRVYLYRETLKVGNDQCAVSSKTEIFQKLDDLITAAKKKNKI